MAPLGSRITLPPAGEPARSLIRSARSLPWPDGAVARAGITQGLDPFAEDRVRLVDICDPGTAPGPVAHEAPRQWEPYVAVAADSCSAMTWQETGGEVAREYLRTVRSARLARELWTGELAQEHGHDNLWLAHTDAVELGDGGGGTTAVDPVTALARLEQALAACGGTGFIHATPHLAVLWDAQGLVVVQGGTIVTEALGTVVVVDAGYPGTGPGGTAATATTQWAYGTTPVYVAQGPIDVTPDTIAEAMDRAVNTVAWEASQALLALWDETCHFAVPVDTTDNPAFIAA